MVFIDESLAKGISKKIIREVFDSLIPNHYNYEAISIEQMHHKKQTREIIKLCKKNNKLVYLDDRFCETSKWELIWGEWALGFKGVGKSPKSTKEYDRLFFDLTYNGKSFSHYKFFYIVLSKHALIRAIMRSGKKITNSSQAFKFIKNLTKELVFGALTMLEANKGTMLSFRGLYFPMVMEHGKNINGEKSVSFTIKTVMPKHFKVNSSELIDRSNFKSTLFEYSDHFPKDNG